MGDLEAFYGKAINLDEHNDRLPFHGSFLFHEMRVRGFWPLREDRAIALPIKRVDWLVDDGDHNQRPGTHETSGGRQLRSHGLVPNFTLSGKVFIPTNPFTNPVALEALKQSSAKQPNWKAAIKEGTTWEGNADENVAKWRKLNRIDVWVLAS